MQRAARSCETITLSTSLQTPENFPNEALRTSKLKSHPWRRIFVSSRQICSCALRDSSSFGIFLLCSPSLPIMVPFRSLSMPDYSAPSCGCISGIIHQTRKGNASKTVQMMVKKLCQRCIYTDTIPADEEVLARMHCKFPLSETPSRSLSVISSLSPTSISLQP
jgi:hypothetical protein